MEDYRLYVPNVHFEQIPIKNLVSNQEYQRDLSQSHIIKAAENFDLHQINPVKVSRRDGVNYVFNGQHTIEIVALVSGSRDTPVWCMIYDDLGYENEADIFANQQKYVKSLTPYEVFYANLEAGNEDQLMIQDILKSYGLRAGPKRAHGVICAIATVESIYKKFGYHVLNRTLRLISGTWEGDVSSFSANMLNGVARVVVSYGNQLDDALFIEKVGALSVKSLTRTAKERQAGSVGFAETMVLAYNGKKKSNIYRLPLSKLYSKESSIFDVLEEVPIEGTSQSEDCIEVTPDYSIEEENLWNSDFADWQGNLYTP